ncbi:unnamed protein product [Vitrella brassicaformis CCMP3155]|uniref:Glutathione transferase n=2 Tax=Vitrella brassicaformis TaxID=1169539 RepID=A0A0G4EXZ5_VITBC|nr:unnamed protein product [Vitrella brassicaformis CCMP3155]|mmetsp:Transcript_30538/g.75812  ORF Transcript_30538/g.75812 Transcript_30538/m.75812 type:complete len:147 (+) Transcript_30538:168-608(+)|eukprot:CEM03494.1 unnamed protein product [Vitrella brassicaformis CCMP3155]
MAEVVLGEELIKAYAAPTAVTIIWIVRYQLIDVLGVGFLRRKHQIRFPIMTGNDEFERAVRAQMNQVEQMPIFLTLMWMFSIMVSPLWGALLGSAWVILRHAYAATYRKSAKVSVLLRLTIPAYSVLIAMMVGIIVRVVMVFIHKK